MDTRADLGECSSARRGQEAGDAPQARRWLPLLLVIVVSLAPILRCLSTCSMTTCSTRSGIHAPALGA